MNNEQTTPQEILKRIVAQFGKQIFDKSASTRLESLLYDYLAHDKAKLKLFRLAVKDNVAHELLQADTLDKAEKAIKINALKAKFQSENFLEESIASEIVACYAYALEWNISEKKETKVKPQPVKKENEWVEKREPQPNPRPKPIPRPQPTPRPQPIPEPQPKSKSFPWLIWIVATILLLGVGGGIGYYMFYLPYKIDKDAPRYYTFAATNTFLRSSQMSGVEYNILARVPYGSELIVYNNNSEWSNVKWNNIKGYINTAFILPQQDFFILNSIFGDNDSKEVINTAKCRIALLGYFKSKGYYGVLDLQLLKSIFNLESLPPDKIWQVFSKNKDSQYNSTYYKRITNKNSKFTDFAVIISNSSTQQRKCLLFSFSDDETPRLEYEENAPQTGDIVSIETGVNPINNTPWYRIKYQ